VPFVVPLTPLRIGVTWRDTLQFETEAEDLSELLSGVWHHEVTGDTVIGGRTLPVVRTQATLRYRLRDVTTDYALEEDLATTYDVSGRMMGTAVVDTTVGVRAAGADSTLLTGTALLHLGGGRAVSSPVRYERRRSWLLRDSSAWALVQDSLRAAQRRQDTGMLMLPRTPLEERLRAGALRSLIHSTRAGATRGIRMNGQQSAGLCF
jgi:carbon monoxide dehydrogenase subunit G